MLTPSPVVDPATMAPGLGVLVEASTLVYAIRFCLTTGGTRAFGEGLDLLAAHHEALTVSDRLLLASDLANVEWPYARPRAQRLLNLLVA